MAVQSRLRLAFMALVRGSIPTIDYLTTYRAKLVRQHANKVRVDVQPDDPRLPAMSNIPLKLGLPGVEVSVVPGDDVLVGWEGGRPDRPYATLFPASGTKPLTLVFGAAVSLMLGGPNLNPVLDGVVRAETPCQFTGAPHAVSGGHSLLVLAKKLPG